MSLKRVYVCGLRGCGKELITLLLDGHSQVCIQPFQGLFTDLFVRELIHQVKNRNHFNDISTWVEKIPTLQLKLRESEKLRKIEYSPFCGLLHQTAYSRLWASYQTRSIEGRSYVKETTEGGLAEFDFDIDGFEQGWRKAFFEENRSFTPIEFLNELYGLFIRHWRNKCQPESQIQYLVTTEKTETDPIQWHLDQGDPDTKLILVQRDQVGMAFTGATIYNAQLGRGRQYNDLKFNLHLYTQPYLQKIKVYHQYLEQLQKEGHRNVFVINFEDYILRTEPTMKRLAEFLEIPFEEVLTRATLNGQNLETPDRKYTGKIHDSAEETLTPAQLDQLRYIVAPEYLEAGPVKQSKLFFSTQIWKSLRKAKDLKGRLGGSL